MDLLDKLIENGEQLREVVLDETCFPLLDKPGHYDWRDDLQRVVFDGLTKSATGLLLIDENGTPIAREEPFRLVMGMRAGRELTLSFIDEEGDDVIPVHRASITTLKRLLLNHKKDSLSDDLNPDMALDDLAAIDAMHKLNHELVSRRILDAFKTDEALPDITKTCPVLADIRFADHIGQERDRRRFFVNDITFPRSLYSFAVFAIENYDEAYRQAAAIRLRSDARLG